MLMLSIARGDIGREPGYHRRSLSSLSRLAHMSL
jgi:hypothetical protein